MTNSYNDYFKKVKATKAPIRKSNSIGSKPLQNDLSDIEMVRATMDKVKNDRKTKLKKGNSFFQEFPTKVALTLAIGLVVAVWGVVDPQNFEHLFSKVEIGIFSQSLAESAGPAKENSAISEQKSTIEKSPDEAKSQLVKKNWTDEEMSYFRQLNERKLELDSREHELEKLEEELQKQKVEIDSRIQKLKVIRAEISKVLKDKVKVDKDKVSKLVAFYSNMKPQQASALIAKIDEDLAVEILGQMKKKNAADILNLLKVDKAQNLSEKFAGYRFK